jgi:hypothetical protein
MDETQAAGGSPPMTVAGDGGGESPASGAEVRSRLPWGRELITVAFATWLLLGLFVDGWAHDNLELEEEGFFTPWHAVFYSGFVACAAWILWQVDRNYRAGRRGLAAIPAGFGLALAGIGVFALGGAGDLVWHSVFGIEQGLEALFSPTHLLLFTGMLLIMSAPLRAAWSDPDEPAAPSFRRFAPVLASATMTTAVLAFAFGWAGAFMNTAGVGVGVHRGPALPARFAVFELEFADVLTSLDQLEGVTSVLATSLIVLAPLLLLMRRWQVPFGTATVLIGGIALLTSAISGSLESLVLGLGGIAAGLGVDVLLVWLRPWADPRRYWAAGGLIPLVVWTLYFVVVAATQGIGWPVELWTGSIVWSALLGTVLAVLLRPPTAPQAGSTQP